MINLNQYLQLTRPLACIDLETTGLSIDTDRIWQIAITMHYPHRDPIPWVSLINPGMPIPTTATTRYIEVNLLVKDAPFFSQVAPALSQKISDVDFCGFNAGRFDLPLIRNEMKRCGVDWDWERNKSLIVDSLKVYQTLCPRRLEDAYREFVDPAGFEGAHDAGRDVSATAEVLAGQLRRNPSIPRTVAELYDYCFPIREGCVDRAGKLIWKGDDACMAVGKHAGKPLQLIPRDYLQWMIGPKGAFPGDVKEIITAALNGQFPKRQVADQEQSDTQAG